MVADQVLQVRHSFLLSLATPYVVGQPRNNQKKSKFNKEYSLTLEETANLKGRDKMADYILDLIHRDIGMYLTQEIYGRLGIPYNTKSEISEDKTKLYVDNSPKIILPNDQN